MKKEISVFEYADRILKGLSRGALLTTKSGERINTMTISWGTLGIEWGKPIFITFVRENRLTREMLDAHPEFTVSVPVESSDKKIGGFCGMNSGRDVDKIAAMKLTPVPSDTVEVPGIGEYPIILECKLLYRQKQDPEAIPEEIRKRDYPADVPSDSPLANRDYHTAYYGEITKAYIVEETKMIERINDANTKKAIARKVLENLRDWFEVDESREKYIRESADQIFLAAKEDDGYAGFLCLKETGKDTVELAVMGVMKKVHRKGLGRQLFEAARNIAVEEGYSFMQVKTVKMGMYEDYDITNRFYLACGFKEFEVIPELWGEENPCQIYVMSLK